MSSCIKRTHHSALKMKSTQGSRRFEAKRSQLSRKLQLKILIERELRKRAEEGHSVFSVLLDVRMSALLDIKHLENLDRQLAYQRDVPILVVRVTSDSAVTIKSWAESDSKIEACLGAYWEYEGDGLFRRLLEPRGLICVSLSKEEGVRQQLEKILSSLEAKTNRITGIPIKSLSRSQRGLVAGPHTSVSTLLDYQLLSKTWLLQEPRLGRIVRERRGVKITDEERDCLRRRALDWVALRPVELDRGHASKYWTPYLVIEFDGLSHEESATQAIDKAKDGILFEAGLPVLRCSYRDFSSGDGSLNEQQFRRDFVIHALLNLQGSHRDSWPYEIEEDTELESQLEMADWHSMLIAAAQLAGAQAAEVVWRSKGGYRYVELHVRHSGTKTATKVLERSPLLKTNFAASGTAPLPQGLFDAFAERWVLQRYIDRN